MGEETMQTATWRCANPDCDNTFKSIQGSNQRYCDQCMLERIRYKGKKKRRR